MRYLRLISFGLLCSPIAISGLENPSNKEIGLDSNKSGISIAEVSRKTNIRFQSLDKNADKMVSFDEFVNQKDSLKNLRQSLRRERPKVAQTRPKRNRGQDRGLKNKPNTRQQRSTHSKELFKILDKDNSASLSYKEFVGGSDPRNHKLARLTASFKRLDKDGDEMLSAKEMLLRVNRLRSLDTNLNGFIEPKEMRPTGSIKHDTFKQKKLPDKDEMGH